MASIDLKTFQKTQPQSTTDNLQPNTPSDDEYTYKDVKLDMEFGGTAGYDGQHRIANTSDIGDLKDIADVKQSLKNIFNTQPGQKLLNPFLGLDLSKFVFEPVSQQTADLIARTILIGVPEQEPRVGISNLNVVGRGDEGAYYVQFTLRFVDVNIDEVQLKGRLTTEGFRIL